MMKPAWILILLTLIASLIPSGDTVIQAAPFSQTELSITDDSTTGLLNEEGDGAANLAAQQQSLLEELLANIDNFVSTPQNGIDWHTFGATKQVPYSYTDAEGMEWDGLRPEFAHTLKDLDGTEILIQGYMFPLGEEEKQQLFLLGPFPISCPFHYHVTPNLIIEVHAKTPVAFSYDPVNIRGKLELVPKDDEYNVFYRLKNAELVK